MPLVHALKIQFRKGNDGDAIDVERADGSRISTTFPRKGPYPHDAIHLIVERTLNLRSAFWGQIAAGLDFDEIGAKVKAAGHASSRRSVRPDAAVHELIQSERLVECFEAVLWSGQFDVATLRSVFAAACAESGVPALTPTDAQLSDVYQALQQFAERWRSLPAGAIATERWDPAADLSSQPRSAVGA